MYKNSEKNFPDNCMTRHVSARLQVFSLSAEFCTSRPPTSAIRFDVILSVPRDPFCTRPVQKE